MSTQLPRNHLTAPDEDLLEPAEPKEVDQPHPDRYRKGKDRYVRFATEVLGLYVTGTQRQILRSIAENQWTYVQAGNGVGKSFTAAIANLAFLFTNPHSVEMATSGSYSVLSDVLWKPMKSLFKEASESQRLPGRTLQNPPRLIVEDNWYFKCVSPTHPDNLEGRHAGTMLITMEECDKPDISEAHFDSAGSMITDGNDRFLAIGNPPKDEANVAYQKFTSDRWDSIWFSSFESHNVLVDAGKLDAPKLPGLVDLQTIKNDWREWNDEEWPGYEAAKHSYTRDDLDERWYRRRLGIIPPTGSQVHRPIYSDHVRAADDRLDDLRNEQGRVEVGTHVRKGIGMDVGHQGGDRTAIIEVLGNLLSVRTAESFNTHPENEEMMRQAIDAAPVENWIAIDAVGEGSGPADRMKEEYDRVFRFKSSSKPVNSTDYKDKKTEAYAYLGRFLRDGGVIGDSELRDELYAAARSMEYSERHRGEDTVLVTSKDPVSKQLGRSPDLLDAAAMAVWASEVENPAKTAGGTARMFDLNPW